MLRHKRMLFQFVQHLLPTSSLSEDNTMYSKHIHKTLNRMVYTNNK